MQAVILTKSVMRKKNVQGACTVAYDLDSGHLVRFVSAVDGSPIPYSVARRYQKLDVVSVRVLGACPVWPQTENLLVDVGSIRRLGFYQPGIEDLYGNYCLPGPPRFLEQKSYKLSSVQEYRHSIELVRAHALSTWKNEYDRTNAHFLLQKRGRNGVFWEPRCGIRVTDADYAVNSTDTGYLDDAILVVSIPTEPFLRNNWSLGYFLFIAAIYPVTCQTYEFSGPEGPLPF